MSGLAGTMAGKSLLDAGTYTLSRDRSARQEITTPVAKKVSAEAVAAARQMSRCDMRGVPEVECHR